jgi:hypothetical protein
MRIFRTLALSAGSLLLAASYCGPSRADEWNKTTKISVNEPVQVPGTVLQPGDYTLKLADSSSDRHIVQIFNGDNTSLVTTVLAIPNYRLQPTGKTVLQFAERPADQPVALEAWFYPGDNFGQEFVYPESEAKLLSQVNKTEVPSTGSEEAYPSNKTEERPAPEATPAQPRTEEPSRTPPSPPPTAAQQSPTYPSESNAAPNPAPNEEHTTPQPAPKQERPRPETKELPQTASLLPVIGLVGFAFLGLALILRLAFRS